MNLFFDADDTLWDEQGLLKGKEQLIETALEKIGATGFCSRFSQLEEDNIPTLGYGVASYAFSLGQVICGAMKDNRENAEVMRLVSDLLSHISQGSVLVFPEVVETLDYLKSEGYTIRLLSRGVESEQHRKLRLSGLECYFSDVVIVTSKTRSTYTSVLKRFAVDPKSSCMIGNSLRSDIFPAMAAGMAAVWLPSITPWSHDEASSEDVSSVVQVDAFCKLPTVIASILKDG